MRLRKQGQIDAKFTKRFVVAFGVVTYLVELAAADRDAPATATAPPPNAVRFRRRRPTSATPQLRQVPPPSASPCAPRHRCTQALPARRGVARCCLVLKTAAEASALAIAGRRGSSGFGFTMRTTMQMHRAGGVPGAQPRGTCRGAVLGAAAAAGGKRSRPCGQALLFPAPCLPPSFPAGVHDGRTVDRGWTVFHLPSTPEVPRTVRCVTHGRDLNQARL